MKRSNLTPKQQVARAMCFFRDPSVLDVQMLLKAIKLDLSDAEVIELMDQIVTESKEIDYEDS